MARRRFSIHNLVGARPPLTLDQIADWWVTKNVGAIAEIAMRSMLDPPGTTYLLPPMRLVGFETPDARILYQLSLHHAAEAHHSKCVVTQAISQHIEELVFFAREQFLTALLRLDLHATFQRDQFAVREER
jgi:hypothetical protein